MSIPENWVLEYYDDIELHAQITITLMGNDNLSLPIMDGEIEYRAQLLGEKFLEDPDTIETDLRRCIFKMRAQDEPIKKSIISFGDLLHNGFGNGHHGAGD